MSGKNLLAIVVGAAAAGVVATVVLKYMGVESAGAIGGAVGGAVGGAIGSSRVSPKD